MIGTGEDTFSPEATLTGAECLTLALRLYDLLRGGDSAFETAPEDWGRLTLTLADGTVFEGYGYDSDVGDAFSWWSWRTASEGVCVWVPGWSNEDMTAGIDAQREWMDAHPDICGSDAPATITLNGVTYQGTALCWMPVGPYVFMFLPEPDQAEEVNSLLHHAIYHEVGPDRWWRDTLYTISQRGLEDVFQPWECATGVARRSDFARLVAAACEGQLEKINTVEAIPDLSREYAGGIQADQYREAAYTLYEAGILTGTDEHGTFDADGVLTRAQAAAICARVLRPELRQRFTAFQDLPTEGYTLTYLMDGEPDGSVYYPVLTLLNDGILLLDGTQLPWPEAAARIEGVGDYAVISIYDTQTEDPYDQTWGALDQNGWLVQPGVYSMLRPIADGTGLWAFTGDWPSWHAFRLDRQGQVVEDLGEVASDDPPDGTFDEPGIQSFGGLRRPRGYEGYYTWGNGTAASQRFDWCYPIGPDGRGFVRLGEKIYRIEFDR